MTLICVWIAVGTKSIPFVENQEREAVSFLVGSKIQEKKIIIYGRETKYIASLFIPKRVLDYLVSNLLYSVKMVSVFLFVTEFEGCPCRDPVSLIWSGLINLERNPDALESKSQSTTGKEERYLQRGAAFLSNSSSIKAINLML